MRRSVPVMAGARGASHMASRSYVFGRDDSNSAAVPTDGSNAQVQLLSACCCCCCCCHTHELLFKCSCRASEAYLPASTP